MFLQLYLFIIIIIYCLPSSTKCCMKISLCAHSKLAVEYKARITQEHKISFPSKHIVLFSYGNTCVLTK